MKITTIETQQDKATERPWKLDGGSITAYWPDEKLKCRKTNGVSISVCAVGMTRFGGDDIDLQTRMTREDKANAALIVTAVNERDGLLAALRQAREALAECHAVLPCNGASYGFDPDPQDAEGKAAQREIQATVSDRASAALTAIDAALEG